MSTLNDFFNTHQQSLEWAGNVTSLAGFQEAKPLIAQELGSVKLPPAFYEKMILKLCEALDLNIGNLLVAGYRKHREITSYRDKENPPEGYHTVKLTDHSLVSKHKPTVQPVINQVPLAEFAFDITLKLTLKAGKLFIQDGAITQIRPGDILGSGEIEFEGIKLLERKTAAYELPGRLVFDPAIPI